MKAFSVAYDSGASCSISKGTMWGNITAGTEGFYVIGVDTGTGPSHPFGALGQPNVTFNGVMFVQKDGTGNIGATSLASMITIAGRQLHARHSAQPAPRQHRFRRDALWLQRVAAWRRRAGRGRLRTGEFDAQRRPEAGTWAMMVAGFVVLGGTMRSRRRLAAFA